MDYLQIKNWTKFQHFGGAALNSGVPPWIKLYVSLLDDYLFCKLTDIEKCHLILLWLLAARLHNQIPNDPDWLKQQVNATEDMGKTIRKLIEYGYLENVAVINPAIYRTEKNPNTPYTGIEEDQNTVSHRREEIREEEIRRDKIREEEGIRPDRHSHKVIVTEIPEKLSTDNFKTAWDKWLAYRKEIGKALKPTSQEASLKSLAAFGPEIAEQAIVQSISNGWQGLFPEKINAQGNGQTTGQASHRKDGPLVAAFRGVNPGADWVDRIDKDYWRTHKKERL